MLLRTVDVINYCTRSDDGGAWEFAVLKAS